MSVTHDWQNRNNKRTSSIGPIFDGLSPMAISNMAVSNLSVARAFSGLPASNLVDLFRLAPGIWLNKMKHHWALLYFGCQLHVGEDNFPVHRFLFGG